MCNFHLKFVWSSVSIVSDIIESNLKLGSYLQKSLKWVEFALKNRNFFPRISESQVQSLFLELWSILYLSIGVPTTETSKYFIL
jgi:hypothetical protein